MSAKILSESFDEPDFATTLWTDSSAKYAFTFSGLFNFGVIVRRYAILLMSAGLLGRILKGTVTATIS